MALAAWVKGMLENIRWGERHRHPLIFGEFVQLICAVYDARGHQVNDSLSAPLHLALHQHQPGRHDGAAITFEQSRPDEHIGDACFIFKRDEDRVAFTRPLTDQHNTRAAHPRTIFRGRNFRTVQHALPPEGRTERSEEHTSELQSLIRTPYPVFSLKKKKKH